MGVKVFKGKIKLFEENKIGNQILLTCNFLFLSQVKSLLKLTNKLFCKL